MALFRKQKAPRQGSTLSEVYRETRWIYVHMRPYKKAIFLYVLLGLISTLMSILMALLSKSLINTIVNLGGSGSGGWRVVQLGVLVVLVSLGNIALGAFVGHFSTRINLRISNALRAEVYGKILSTDWQSLQEFHSGDLLNRINTDVTTISQSVLGWVPTLIIKLAQFLLSLLIILWFDPTMALLAIGTAPFTLLVARPFVGKMRRLSKEVRNVSSEMMAFHGETLQNVQPIKAFNLTGPFRKRLDQVQQKHYNVSMEMNRFSILNSTLLSACSCIISYLCLGWCAYRLWLEAIDFGTLILFIQMAGYVSAALTALIKLVPAAIECTVAAQRVMTVFDLPAETEEYGDRVQQLMEEDAPYQLELRKMDFAYSGRKPVLRQLDLQLKQQEMVAIIGASGSGKTTLFRILLGLLTPTSGSALLLSGGEEIPLSPSTRCMFSYVPQDNVIFSGSIADMLRMVRPDATDEDIYRALGLACAEDFVRALPDGIHSSIKERGGSLSEGQNQRLAIARAILADAPILLLDEVTSALDLETERKVLKNITSLSGKTCILTTHRPSVLSLCHHVYRIEGTALRELDREAVRALRYQDAIL
ncbi:MAG: ABC transporter ATP-binding protein [Oscillospiraceae bacterium]|nr:ABC transporter ATP-binding protein [Oscillospiraceae bacterium]